VVVNQFNIARVSVLESKDHAPVCPNRDSIEPFPVPFQRMRPEAWQIHIVRTGRTIEHRKDIFDLLKKVSSNPFSLTVFKQPLQCLALEVLDHRFTLLCQLTIVNYHKYHS
jgi:hypothetical protein